MKKSLQIIVISVVVVIAGLVLYLAKTGRLATKPAEVAAPAAQQATGHEAHGGSPPAQKADEGEAQEEVPTVEIPSDKQQMISVKISEVAVRELSKTIRTVGRIEYDEKRLATINAKFEGWIERLHVDYTGRYVKKGEPLAEIYSPELVATQQELINAVKWKTPPSPPLGKAGNEGEVKTGVSDMLSRDAGRIIEAARQRLKLWDISEAQIKKIEESGAPVRTLTIFSPVSGYVVQKAALQGMRVMPGEKLFDIADLSTVWVVADVYEAELPLIKTGAPARLGLSYFPGKEFSSKVDYVYPSLSGETRTARVRFTLPNPGMQLKPQMFTDVMIKVVMGRKLSIPDDSVIDTGTRQVVYVDRGEGYFEPREVMLGIRAEGFREVLKGLKAGEKVASSATFLIDSEAQLKNVTPLEGHKH